MDLLQQSVNSPRAPVACDICGKMFSNKANMNRHRISHSDTKTFECRLCNKQFHRKDQLQEHWMTHAKPNGEFDCPVLDCVETFSCFNHLKNHTEQGHSITATTPVCCKHCLIPYKTARRLMIHYHTRDLIFEDQKINNSDDTLNSTTDSMDVSATPEGKDVLQQFLGISMLKLEPVQHRKRKAQPVKVESEMKDASFNNLLLDFVNQHCNLTFTSEDPVMPVTVENVAALQNEVAESSNRSTPDSIDSGNATESSKCDESVDFEHKRHKTEEPVEEKATSNSECELPIDTGINLQNASEMTDTEKYDCKICDITYHDQTMFLMHMGFHTMNEPLRCNMCGEVCANRFEFNSHLMYGEHRQNVFDFNK